MDVEGSSTDLDLRYVKLRSGPCLGIMKEQGEQCPNSGLPAFEVFLVGEKERVGVRRGLWS